MLQNIRSRTNTSVITSLSPIQSTSYENANSICLANLPAWIQLASLASFSPRGWPGGQHYTLQNSYIETLQHILPNIPDNDTIDSWLPLAQNAPWTVENTRDWMDKTPTSTHDLSVWSSSSLGRWHPRSSVLLVLTRHSSPILNERWTRVINLSMFFLLCYDLTTILRSRALHRVLSSAIQYAWRSYMLSRLYRKVKTFRSDLLT
jgi:hypothetical protein